MRYDDREDIEWTDAERGALEALPRERVPIVGARERTIAGLRTRGLLGPSERRRPSAVWLAVAASVVFSAGGVAGYRLALSRVRHDADVARMRIASQEPAPAVAPSSDAHVVWF
ncbi:MAG TPA: hypothetical protein VM076_05480 [Gemmatimonadaceae bacterium]|nr:hypothetical protein [Gemmatimonadaceae bacterium]